MPSTTTSGFVKPVGGDAVSELRIAIGANADLNETLLGLPTWTDATLLNSWVSGGAPWFTPGYYKLNGRVYVRGMATSGSVNATVFTLPSGYRPASTVEFACVSQAGNTCRVQISSAGTVVQVITTQTTIGLDVISFRT